LFGYSRGAFVARKVVSLIYRIGVDVHERDALLKRWSQHEKPVPWDMPNSRTEGKNVRIKFGKMFSCVGYSSIFTKPASSKDANLLGIPDSELPPNVEHALHAMAFHENRRLFRATLFKPNNNTKLKEIWFPGAHADVGGGGKFASDLPNISLLWVISEMATYLHIPIPDLEYPDLNTLIPTDAYHDSSACRRLLDSAIQWDIKAYLRIGELEALGVPAYPDRMPPAPTYYPLTQEKQPLQGYLMSKTVALAPSHIHPIGIILLK
ncbi:hypothetical protein FRC09_004185, partial [Ceratobasidium sp. 395]